MGGGVIPLSQFDVVVDLSFKFVDGFSIILLYFNGFSCTVLLIFTVQCKVLLFIIQSMKSL